MKLAVFESAEVGFACGVEVFAVFLVAIKSVIYELSCLLEPIFVD